MYVGRRTGREGGGCTKGDSVGASWRKECGCISEGVVYFVVPTRVLDRDRELHEKKDKRSEVA